MNKYYIGGAGSGKTTFFVREAIKIKDKKVLITTFTENNESEIRKKIIEENGCIPDNIKIQTWFSFLLQHWVRPYQAALHQDFKKYEIKGMLLVNGSSSQNKNKNKIQSPNRENDHNHYDKYFTKNHLIYSDKVAYFGFEANKQSKKKVIERLEKIYDHIYIDEAQDLAGYDLNIIKIMLESKMIIKIFGDPRQRVYRTNQGQKNKKFPNLESYLEKECTQMKNKNSLEINSNTLSGSYRCTEKICNLSNKLYPEMTPVNSMTEYYEEHQGVFIVNINDVEDYLKQYSPMQLGYNKNTQYSVLGKYMNFGESKGLTFDRVLIYPTDPIKKWLKDRNNELKPDSKARFYVALTRAKYSAGIVLDNNSSNIDYKNLEIEQYRSNNSE